MAKSVDCCGHVSHGNDDASQGASTQCNVEICDQEQKACQDGSALAPAHSSQSSSTSSIISFAFETITDSDSPASCDNDVIVQRTDVLNVDEDVDLEDQPDLTLQVQHVDADVSQGAVSVCATAGCSENPQQSIAAWLDQVTEERFPELSRKRNIACAARDDAANARDDSSDSRAGDHSSADRAGGPGTPSVEWPSSSSSEAQDSDGENDPDSVTVPNTVLIAPDRECLACMPVGVCQCCGQTLRKRKIIQIQ